MLLKVTTWLAVITVVLIVIVWVGSMDGSVVITIAGAAVVVALSIAIRKIGKSKSGLELDAPKRR